MDLEVNADIPLIEMVTRLTHQKGIDLILQASEEILNRRTIIILDRRCSLWECSRSLEHYRHDRVRSIFIILLMKMSAKSMRQVIYS